MIIDINGVSFEFYTAEEITRAVNGEAAAGLHASTHKFHYKVNYIKNVLRKIEKEPLVRGYTPEFKKIIRVANKKGAPKAYSMYYVYIIVNQLTSEKNQALIRSVEESIENARITRKQIEKMMLNHGRYFPNSQFPQKFEFIKNDQKEPDINEQQSFIDSLYKLNYRRIKSISNSWKEYRKEIDEILNTDEISDKRKIELLKAPELFKRLV